MLYSFESEHPSDNDEELAELCYDIESSENDEQPNCCCSNINQCSIPDKNYWKAIVEMNGLHIEGPSINVLSDNQKSLLKVINKIQDPEIKLKMLEVCYSEAQKAKSENLLSANMYSMKELMNFF
mgnify:CR=1 FL=1